MHKPISILKVLFLLIFTSVNSISAQTGIKQMIKRSLNEKSVLKLNNYQIEDTPAKLDRIKLKFRNSGFGERLVYDNTKGSESELFAAINPVDSNNIVVGVIHFAYNQFSESPLSISLYYTNDFGDTWQKSDFNGVLDKSLVSVGGGDPVLVFDKQGNLHLTYLLIVITDLLNSKLNEFVYHAISKDGGITWKADTYFKSAQFRYLDLEGIDKFLDKQWMVADFTSSPYSGNVYMAYVDFNIQDTSINMMIDVIEPGDTTFSYHPVQVSNDSFKFVQYASLDIDNSGNLYFGFVGSYDSIRYNFYNCVSIDGGKSFSEPRKISELYFPGFTMGAERSTIVGIAARYFPSPYIAIDKSDGKHSGRIYATWTCPGIDTIEETGSDIYLSYSDDGGEVWANPIIINNDSLPNSDQFYSNLEVNSKGIPIVCFYDKRADGNNQSTQYFISYALNPENLNFDTQFSMTESSSDFSKIGNKTNGFGIGEYNKTISTGSFALPFWSDGRKNTGDVNVYMAIIPLDGKEYTTAIKNISIIPDNISDILISPNPNNGFFSLSYNLRKTSNVSIDVFDISGKKIYTDEVSKKSEGIHFHNIDLTSYKKGIYIVKIKTDFGILSKNIIVN